MLKKYFRRINKNIMARLLTILLFICLALSCEINKDSFAQFEPIMRVEYDLEEFSYENTLNGEENFVQQQLNRPQITRQHVLYSIGKSGEINLEIDYLMPKINMDITPYPKPDDLPHISKLVISDNIQYLYDQKGLLIEKSAIELSKFHLQNVDLNIKKNFSIENFIQRNVNDNSVGSQRTESDIIITSLENGKIAIKSQLVDPFNGFDNNQIQYVLDTISKQVLGYAIYNSVNQIQRKVINVYSNPDDIFPYMSSYEDLSNQLDQIVYTKRIQYFENVNVQAYEN